MGSQLPILTANTRGSNSWIWIPDIFFFVFRCITRISIHVGSTMSTQRLCDLSSAGKFGRGGAETKPHNLQVDVVDPASTTDITSKSS